MKVFLLDTNIVSALLDQGRRDHSDVKRFIAQLNMSSDRLYTCPIVIGEIRYGYEVCFAPDNRRRRMILDALKRFPVKDIDRHTVPHYARVRAALFRKYGKQVVRRGLKTIRKQHPETLIDQSTAHSLGIDENDLWIAACALRYKMTLVTADKMNRLRDVVCNNVEPSQGWLLWKTSPTAE